MWDFAILGGAAIGALGLAVLLLFRRLGRVQHAVDFDVEWLEEFSASRYRPMERLFNQEDFEFLASQRGYTPALGRKLWADRRKAFRSYLRAMRKDFDRLLIAGKVLYLASPEPDPAFASTLYQYHAAFMRNYYRAQFQLLLHALGLARVDVRGLIQLLDAAGSKVRSGMAMPLASDMA